MDTKQQINQIIQKRKEKAAELQIQREEFAKLRMALKKINGLEHKKSELTNDEMRKEFILKFKGLELKEAMRQADELMREYDTVIKRTIYHSFEPDMSYFAKVSMFFRYLPFAIALKASLDMSARTALRRLHR